MAQLRPTYETAWAFVLAMNSEIVAGGGFDDINFDALTDHMDGYIAACQNASRKPDGSVDMGRYVWRQLVDLGAVAGAFVMRAAERMHQLDPSMSAHEHFTALADDTRVFLEDADEVEGNLGID